MAKKENTPRKKKSAKTIEDSISPIVSPLPIVNPTPQSAITPIPVPPVKKEVKAVNELDQVLSEHINKKIQELINEQVKTKHSEYADYKPLETMMSEYLKSFVVIGYNLQGDRILMGYSKTRQEHDALMEHLRAVFMKFMTDPNM